MRRKFKQSVLIRKQKTAPSTTFRILPETMILILHILWTIGRDILILSLINPKVKRLSWHPSSLHVQIPEIRIKCESLLDECIRVGVGVKQEIEGVWEETNQEVDSYIRRRQELDRRYQESQLCLDRYANIYLYHLFH